MCSIKKKIPKDSIEQDTCQAIEDYLRESDQKYNYKNDDYLYLSGNNKNNFKMTSLKDVSIIPTLEDYNFIDIIAQYIKSEKLSKNNYLSEKEISQNDYKTIDKNKISENKEKEEISQGTEKVEILEDGSICIKNTTGMISPSLGEKLVEIKNSNNEDINKEIDQDLLINSKLLISNDIKFLDENENEDKELNDIKNNSNSYNEKNDEYDNNYDKFDFNTHSRMSNSLPNIIKNNTNEVIPNLNTNCIYFSTSKKNKLKLKNNSTISKKKKIISTKVRKKKLLKSEDNKLNNIYNNILNKDLKKEKVVERKNNYFIKEIEINNSNIKNYNNELSYKRILFGDNFKEDDDIINLWKYLSNKYIKNYNNNLLLSNIQIITQNLKIQKFLEKKNKPKNLLIENKNSNSFNENNEHKLIIKEDYNNIENIDNQDNVAQSINIIEYNNKNEYVPEFVFEPTNISYILNPPITNYNNTYENSFEELNELSDENIKIYEFKDNLRTYNELNRIENLEINDEYFQNDPNNIKKKYQGDIESINEEMNESLEEQESNDNKSQDKKILSNNDNLNNNENVFNKKIQIQSELIDKFKINIDISNLSTNFKLIEMMYKNTNETEIKDIESLSYSPISATSSNIKFPKNKEKNRCNISNFNIHNDNKIYKISKSYSLNVINNEDISLSKETETELSDEEIIFDKKGKILNNNNLLIKNYLIYKIVKYNNKIKLVFGNTILDNDIQRPRYSINIKSYQKILKMMFYKKRKPITKNSYESLIGTIINNFSIYKREFSLKKVKKIYNEQENERINNNSIEMDNKILELEDKVKELKNCYIYALFKKQYIKDKFERKKFLKDLNIPEKRNTIKSIYKKIINLLNAKINDGEINRKYYQKMIDILKNYEKINDKDIKEGIKNIENNIDKEILHNSNKMINSLKKNDKTKNDYKKKIFILFLPMMFIINYFANNFKINDDLI